MCLRFERVCISVCNLSCYCTLRTNANRSPQTTQPRPATRACHDERALCIYHNHNTFASRARPHNRLTVSGAVVYIIYLRSHVYKHHITPATTVPLEHRRHQRRSRTIDFHALTRATTMSTKTMTRTRTQSTFDVASSRVLLTAHSVSAFVD